MKRRIIFTGLFLFFTLSCFSQEITNMEILKQKINLIVNSFYEDRENINNRNLENVIEALNDIFILENNYDFRIDRHRSSGGDDNRFINVFNRNNIIARITLYFCFQNDYDNVVEYLYARIGLYYNGLFTDIEIKNDDNIDDIHSNNIRFTHTHHDLENHLFYYNIYRTIGYHAYEINQFNALIEHYLPLMEKRIIYRWRNENRNMPL